MKKIKKIAKLRPRKRVRRNPMARALEMSEKKHESAVVEWQKCLGRMQFLKEEIPRLEGIIHALGGTLGRPFVGAPPMVARDVVPGSPVAPEPTAEVDQTAAILTHPLSERIPTGPVPASVIVPNHIKHMVKEHPLVLKGAGDVQGQVAAVDFPED
jgi:hypothetical protein